MKDFEGLAKTLQSDLGLVDLMSSRSGRNHSGMELLVIKLSQLKLKIYQEDRHELPHIHVDYGNISHAASFGIDPAVRLVGQLEKKYDRTIISWIEAHQAALLALWNALQAGTSTEALITELRGDA